MKTQQRSSRYRVRVSEQGLEFSTTRISHLLWFIGYAFGSVLFWFLGLAADFPRDAWLIRLSVCIGAAGVTYCALTQLRLLTIGETFLFDTKDGTVRRYGRVICLTKDITSIDVKRRYWSEAIYLYLVLRNRRRVTIDSLHFGESVVDNESYSDAVEAAEEVANYLGVPRTAESMR